MKKLLTILAIGVLTLSYADYNKGSKYYNRYIKKPTKLKSTTYLKDFNITTQKKLDCIISNNRLFEATLKDENLSKRNIKKVIKHKKDIKDFLNGVINGKIPASCG